MMSKAFFITGTDTGIGKTFVTSLIIRYLRGTGIDVGVMKPIETGCGVDEHGILEPPDTLILRKCSDALDRLDTINPYRFRLPLAPSMASRRIGKTIKLSKIMSSFHDLLQNHDTLLVEGAGGLMVPITDKITISDLIKYMDIPLIVIAGSRLGAINHTLLTVDTALNHGITVSGIILNQYDRHYDTDLKEELESFTDVPILGEIPFIYDTMTGIGLNNFVNMALFHQDEDSRLI